MKLDEAGERGGPSLWCSSACACSLLISKCAHACLAQAKQADVLIQAAPVFSKSTRVSIWQALCPSSAQGCVCMGMCVCAHALGSLTARHAPGHRWGGQARAHTACRPAIGCSKRPARTWGMTEGAISSRYSVVHSSRNSSSGADGEPTADTHTRVRAWYHIQGAAAAMPA